MSTTTQRPDAVIRTTWTHYSQTWQTTWTPGSHRWASVYCDSTGAWRWVVLTEHGQEEWVVAGSREEAASAACDGIAATTTQGASHAHR